MKFHVKRAADLQTIWDKYTEEKQEREKMEQASQDYVYYQKEIFKAFAASPYQGYQCLAASGPGGH